MSKLISVVGASGVGKTTFVSALAKAGNFATAYEQHIERPFQNLFKQNKSYALANQFDYFLLRAEQEKELRTSPHVGLIDGGLDLDFHGFTRLFLSRNLLSQSEFDLCRRLYMLIRTQLPQPELIIRLNADVETVASRLSTRDRVNIASAADTVLFNSYLDEWLITVPSDQVLTIDISNESLDYSKSINLVVEYKNKHF